MATQGLNLSLRTNATPQQLLKELLLSPLIYIRLAGIVSATVDNMVQPQHVHKKIDLTDL